MPDASVQQEKWPHFVGYPEFGWWFWTEYAEGRMVSLGEVIGKTAGTVFWVEPERDRLFGAMLVERDVPSTDGWTLPAGLFVYQGTLEDDPASAGAYRSGDAKRTDLAPRFAPGMLRKTGAGR
jgi:hypothetical protein